MQPAETQASISMWADQTFGPVQDQTVLINRAAIELQELKEAVTAQNAIEVGKETADVLILLMRLLENHGLNMQDVVNQKMQENRSRTWKSKGDGTGSHIKA